ncbi:ArsB/NhaD family transporter [Pseudomonas sp.]|uniref:SLC13 family permease n=1 Tax=Pseudomonas sp. TaxID=306 RepID=UPI00271A924B|nr:ArsB/NhaD family transporter [Pseudomonas sp.]MDO8707076.1 ArsB/NhaD family transporter [Pseudomonas sp.]
MTELYIGTTIFILSYIAIVSERIHKTIIAIVGASAMLLFKIMEQREAFFSEEFGIDYNVIFLLIGMMIIINIMKDTGVFEWIAIKSAKFAKGEPIRIMVTLSVVTAFLSAFLDNVTTVLLVAPVTLLICDALEIDSVPFLITEAIASNIGGTATLIGDPPNIMIASKAKLEFMDFIYNLAPVVIIIMVAYIFTVKWMFKKSLTVKPELQARIMEMKESEAITDPALTRKSLFVLALTVLGFIFHSQLGFEPATIALSGAGLLLLVAGKEPNEILEKIEWTTLFFFMGLFIMVGGVVKVGLIKILAEQALNLTQGNMFATSMLVLWFSAFASAIIDNIPYVATMNPLIIDMAKGLWPNVTDPVALVHTPALMPVWWSLALGACLGGNGTLIGASANVVVAGMAEKAGKKITFMQFTKYGMPLMIESVIICTFYIWIRYYLL